MNQPALTIAPEERMLAALTHLSGTPKLVRACGLRRTAAGKREIG